MKTISKELLFKHSSTVIVKREIKIQSMLRHPHIVKLFYFFEDAKNVYMILEYAENGISLLTDYRIAL